MSTAHLRLTPAGAGWQAEWSCDDRPVAPPIPLDTGASRALRDLAPRFLALFEHGRRPFHEPADLRLLGRTLFDNVFAPAWSAVAAALGAGPHLLLLHCAEPELLNLPWELVEPHPVLPLGCDPAWGLLRVPAELPAAAPDPGPLRLLFLAAAPTDQPLLDFEREEDAMLRATGRLPQEMVVLPFAETGGIDELAALVAEHRPHVVHLSGHGIVKGGVGHFAFEDERGHTDSRPVEEIATRVFRGSAVRCVVLNACQSSQAAAAGLAQGLVRAGVPLVLGWAASVADDRATDFITALYRFLARGDSVPVSAARAREDIWRHGRQRRGTHELVDPTFALPQLYAGGAAVELVDRAAPRRRYEGPRTVRTLIDGEIKGLREGFVGRRRIQQKLFPALRDGAVTFAVLHGLGGMGKSTLATRAAGRLREAGFTVYGVKPASGQAPTAAGRDTMNRLLDALSRAFLFAGREDLNNLLTQEKLPLGQRLRLAAQGLRQLRVVLVLDNFEDVLDLASRRILDPDLSAAYQILARELVDGSRVLVTCRYLPAETPVDQPTVWHEDLAELSEAEFDKFLRRDSQVDGRLRRGEISGALVAKLYGLLGGTPGFLEQVRTLLRTADPDTLADDPLGEGLPLEEKRQRYYERILLPQLYAALPPPAQQLASRLAVSELPLPPDALAGLLGIDEESAVAAAEAGVAYGLVQAFREEGLPTLYHPPGLVRPWLAGDERLGTDQRRAADGFLARFWRQSYEAHRENTLRVPADVELIVCRFHAKRADDAEAFRWATVLLAWRLDRRSEWRQARALLEEVPDEDRDGPCWHDLASFDLYQGAYAAAREKFSKALAKWRSINNRAGEAATWYQLGLIDLNEGAYAAAREKSGEALAIMRDTGDRAGEAASWAQLAAIDLYEGAYAAARENFAKALAMRQAISDQAGEAVIWHNLATIDLYEGAYTAARENFGKALAINVENGCRAGEAATWHQLGSIDLEEGADTAAREKFGKALAIQKEIGDRANEAAAWSQLSRIDAREGAYDAAREKSAKALAIQKEIGDRAGEAVSWAQLAAIDSHERNYAAARENSAKALAIQKEIGDRAGEAATWHNLAYIDLYEGAYTAARENFGKALATRHALGDRAGKAATCRQLGNLAWRTGKREAGIRLVALSFLIHRAIGHGDSDQDLNTLLSMCGEVGYEQEQVEELLRSVGEAYTRDRGRQLLLDAFPDWKDTLPG
jgi:tetratricopeptide (TPR) repeat protein